MDNHQHPSPEEYATPALLFCRQQDLGDETYAVIRITWFIDGRICGISETSIKIWERDIIQEFTEILKNALLVGCEVSVVCIDDMECLGLIEA